MDGMLVSKKWLDAANDKLFPNGAAESESPKKSLFYDVRPIRIAGATWTAVGTQGWYTTTAWFIGQDGKADSSYVLDVYAYKRGGVSWRQGAETYAIWRGRWELLDGGHPTQTTYTAGTAIELESVGTSYKINNKGFWTVRTSDGNYSFTGSSQNGEITLDKKCFLISEYNGVATVSLKTGSVKHYTDVSMPELTTRNVVVNNYNLRVVKNSDGVVTDVELQILSTDTVKVIQSYTAGTATFEYNNEIVLKN